VADQIQITLVAGLWDCFVENEIESGTQKNRDRQARTEEKNGQIWEQNIKSTNQ
jgi:hypothetical protein